MDNFNKKIRHLLEANDFPTKCAGKTEQEDKETKKIIGQEDAECKCKRSPVNVKSILRSKKKRSRNS